MRRAVLALLVIPFCVLWLHGCDQTENPVETEIAQETHIPLFKPKPKHGNMPPDLLYSCVNDNDCNGAWAWFQNRWSKANSACEATNNLEEKRPQVDILLNLQTTAQALAGSDPRFDDPALGTQALCGGLLAEGATSIEIIPGGKQVLEIDEEIQFTARTICPGGQECVGKLIWESNKKEVADLLDDNGLVKVKGQGKAVIAVYSASFPDNIYGTVQVETGNRELDVVFVFENMWTQGWIYPTADWSLNESGDDLLGLIDGAGYTDIRLGLVTYAYGGQSDPDGDICDTDHWGDASLGWAPFVASRVALDPALTWSEFPGFPETVEDGFRSLRSTCHVPLNYTDYDRPTPVASVYTGLETAMDNGGWREEADKIVVFLGFNFACINSLDDVICDAELNSGITTGEIIEQANSLGIKIFPLYGNRDPYLPSVHPKWLQLVHQWEDIACATGGRAFIDNERYSDYYPVEAFRDVLILLAEPDIEDDPTSQDDYWEKGPPACT